MPKLRHKEFTEWPVEAKMEAVQSYLLLGNLAMTSRILNIPEITLRVWKTQPWWHEAVADFRSAERVELSAKLKKIVGASLQVVEDRLLNGNYQFDQKTGEMVRVPVQMKDAHKVAVDLSDRAHMLEKADDSPLAEDAVEDKLLKLASKFAELATKQIQQKQDEARTLDIEDAQVKVVSSPPV